MLSIVLAGRSWNSGTCNHDTRLVCSSRPSSPGRCANLMFYSVIINNIHNDIFNIFTLDDIPAKPSCLQSRTEASDPDQQHQTLMTDCLLYNIGIAKQAMPGHSTSKQHKIALVPTLLRLAIATPCKKGVSHDRHCSIQGLVLHEEQYRPVLGFNSSTCLRKAILACRLSCCRGDNIRLKSLMSTVNSSVFWAQRQVALRFP